MPIKTKGGLNISVECAGDTCVDMIIENYHDDGGSFYINLSLPPEEAELLSRAIMRHVGHARKSILAQMHCDAINRATGQEHIDIMKALEKTATDSHDALAAQGGEVKE